MNSEANRSTIDSAKERNFFPGKKHLAAADAARIWQSVADPSASTLANHALRISNGLILMHLQTVAVLSRSVHGLCMITHANHIFYFKSEHIYTLMYSILVFNS